MFDDPFGDTRSTLATAVICLILGVVIVGGISMFVDFTSNEQKMHLTGTPHSSLPSDTSASEVVYQTELTADEYATVLESLDAPVTVSGGLSEKLHNTSYIQVDGHFYDVTVTSSSLSPLKIGFSMGFFGGAIFFVLFAIVHPK